VDFEFSPEEKKFKHAVHQFFQSEPELCTGFMEEWHGGEGFGPRTWALLRKLGEKHWLTPTWPKKYGGLELPYIYYYIIQEEMSYWIGLYACIGTAMAGPVILKCGTEEQKDFYLPRIARGEIEFCLGYSEPQAGSDLANLQLRAEDKGDYYLLNGQKTFNTRCHFAQYHWLAARTSSEGPKYRGISLFIVDLETPGISIMPLMTFSGERTNDVFYDDVKVPKSSLVGEPGMGFYYIMEALAYERVTPVGAYQRLFEQLLDYIKESGKGTDPVIRQKIAELAIELEVCKLFTLNVVSAQSKGIVPVYEANAAKIFITETEQRLANTVVNIFGLRGQLQRDSKWNVLNGMFEFIYRQSLMELIMRGTSEILRNVIAQRGLGLKRR
jgi:hypothetical protein